MPIRIKDSYQKYIFEFADEILIVCPKCGKQALVIGRGFKFLDTNSTDVKLVCENCGHSKYLQEKPDSILYSSNDEDIAGKYFLVGLPVDPFFHEPLWLKINCCNHTLWAYNYRHLKFLETHVEAELRERNTQPPLNSSLGSSLPKWMVSSENRADVLKCISHLQGKQ